MIPRVVGIQPWFPAPFSRWKWFTEPVPAERMAALRIATAAVVLLDILFTYLPCFAVAFSPDALGGKDAAAWRFRDGHFYWSVLRWLPDEWGPAALLGVWFAAAVALLVGWRPLISGLVVWACAVSFWNISPALTNGGDRLRNTLFLMVACGCSGAVWGVSSVRERGDPRPILVPGWPVKVLLVQLAALYFFSGLYKIANPAWRTGYVMYFVSHDLAWSNTPALSSRLPVWVHQMSAWVTLVWELGFPVLVFLKGTRTATLVLGVVFHLATFFTLEVAHFALYAIAYYAAFVPWERYRSAAPLRCDDGRGDGPE